jgi:hypothetical protein
VNEEAVRERHAAGVGIKAIMKQFKLGAARVREICGLEAEMLTGPAEPASWIVTIEVPALKLAALIQDMTGDELIAFLLTMPPQTQADAVMFSFQRRMDAIPNDGQYEEVPPDGATEV